MSYRGAGQEERVTSGGTSYQYDLTGLAVMSNASGTTYFTRTPVDGHANGAMEGDLISERTPGGTYYYLVDGNNSVVGITDANGNLVNQYGYDPYGNATSASEQVANAFRYVSTPWDSFDGLYKMGERYYGPSVGRFTQVDPAPSCTGTVDLANRYAYAGGDPVNYDDSSGLKKVKKGADPKKKRAGLQYYLQHAARAYRCVSWPFD